MSNHSGAVKAFDWFQRFLVDVAGVAQEVDSGLRTAEFVSAYDNACMWDRSNSLQGFDQWLPRYVLRVYVAQQYKRQKPASSTPYWGYFAVYLRPTRLEKLPEPIASWGVVSQMNQMEPVDRWKPSVEVGIAHADPHFLSSTHVEAWHDVAAGLRPAEFELMQYMARPVMELNTADAVKRIVVTSLVERLRELKTNPSRATAL